MQALDKMTFEEAVSAPTVAASLLGMGDEPVPIAMPAPGSGRKRAAVKLPHRPSAPRHQATGKRQ